LCVVVFCASFFILYFPSLVNDIHIINLTFILFLTICFLVGLCGVHGPTPQVFDLVAF
jgi:hypothetical protein